MQFASSVEESLVLYDGATEGATELVADQVVADHRGGIVGEPILGSVGLCAVILESRSVPLISSALQHSVGHEAARLAVLRRKIIGDHTVFLDGIGGDGGICSARALQGDAPLPLFIVIGAFDQIV